MKFKAQKFNEESRFTKALRQAGAFAVAAALSLSFAAGFAAAGDHSRSAGDARRGDNYESRIYGTVEKVPQGEVGTWVVNGREIVVTKETRIKEKHGKAEAGAYVEVEGNAAGNAFTAYEIEVKRAR